ncbi:MAG: hypothetical protein JST91_10875 [Actinobacteria bacterium]|nr:hypothetical protein [Actinomycetota bacterium]
MKNLTITTIAAAALTAGLFGLAAPANATTPGLDPSVTISADIDHHGWIQDIQQQVNVPKVDTTVRHSGR